VPSAPVAAEVAPDTVPPPADMGGPVATRDPEAPPPE
jgi:hypothetical protein